jgi:mediator of RNA polymerase II transcription subunit 14
MPGIDMYSSAARISPPDHFSSATMDGKRVNGMLNGTTSPERSSSLTGFPHEMPPDIIHISHGFFPFTLLINRATQQCWNDLSDLLAGFGNSRLADMTTPSMELNKPLSGKAAPSQSDELRRRKLGLLEFCQAKRAEYIKLLVLSNWSRQAAEVSRLVDLQAFIRMRYDSYNDALALTAAMNRDLIRAQIATPDLKTSLEVLSASQVQTIQMVGNPSRNEV